MNSRYISRGNTRHGGMEEGLTKGFARGFAGTQAKQLEKYFNKNCLGRSALGAPVYYQAMLLKELCEELEFPIRSIRRTSGTSAATHQVRFSTNSFRTIWPRNSSRSRLDTRLLRLTRTSETPSRVSGRCGRHGPSLHLPAAFVTLWVACSRTS